MSTFRGGSSIATLLVAGALALGACGSDDNKDSGTTAATATTGTTETTDTQTTGTTERTQTREDRTTKTERGDDSGGRNSGSGGGGSKKGGDDSGSTPQPAAQPGNVYKVAKTVCNSFLPKQIAKDLKDGDRKPESVARDYSKGFPDKQRQRAYEGCLAGLKAR